MAGQGDNAAEGFGDLRLRDVRPASLPEDGEKGLCIYFSAFQTMERSHGNPVLLGRRQRMETQFGESPQGVFHFKVDDNAAKVEDYIFYRVHANRITWLSCTLNRTSCPAYSMQ